MSDTYRTVQWSPAKKRYDAIALLAVVLAVASFVAVGAWLRASLTAETLVIRAVGGTAFALLHVILAIGPLCRLDPRFLPLLANRRHLGVGLALLALVHGGFALFQFHALGDLHPLVSVLVSDPDTTGSLADAAFQPFGLAALVVLVLMAATSHDFWLANLTAPTWKALHMAVYGAYGLLVAHVALGVLQSETSPLYPVLLGAGMAGLGALHLAAAWREARRDRVPDLDSPRHAPEALARDAASPDADWTFACTVDAIPEKRARIAVVAGERVAIFRNEGRLSAISNVCQHQNGPLGEGRIEHGCVVCPWHGYEYDPASGRAPAPFRERIPTFALRLEGDRVFVRTRPNPPGTFVEPIAIPGARPAPRAEALAASGHAESIGRTPAAIATPDADADGAAHAHTRARFLAPRIAALVLAAPIVLGLLAAAQRDVVPSLFEFGRERVFVGWLAERPIPSLSILRPGDVGACGATSILPLVAPGKHGAAERIAGLDGVAVRLRGTLAHVDGQALIELTEAPIERLGDAPASAPDVRVESLGRHRLVGEIVDSKCHFGVMNPATGKVHRACAARCISGGIPPALLLRVKRQGEAEERAVLLLVDRSGRGVGREVLRWVGLRVAIEGEVVRHGDLLVFEIEPSAIEAEDA
ncbi:MAG: ferric reductase-like transmembrane domain-containing protein [Myxococcota bacterium]